MADETTQVATEQATEPKPTAEQVTAEKNLDAIFERAAKRAAGEEVSTESVADESPAEEAADEEKPKGDIQSAASKLVEFWKSQDETPAEKSEPAKKNAAGDEGGKGDESDEDDDPFDIELPDTDTDAFETEFRKIPKAMRAVYDKAMTRVRNLEDQVIEAFKHVQRLLIPLANERDDAVFDEFLSERATSDESLADVFGSGKTAKLAADSVPAKARAELRKRLEKAASLDPASIGLDRETLEATIIEAVRLKYQKDAVASKRASEQPRENGKFVAKPPTKVVRSNGNGHAGNSATPESKAKSRLDAIFDRAGVPK